MAKVEIVKMARSFVQGERGTKGGAPSKDSIWGIAFVQGNLVKFFGRRGGVIRFKAQKKTDLADCMAMYESKLAGKGIEFAYQEVAPDQYDVLHGGDFMEAIGKSYYKARANKQINTRATHPVKKAKAGEETESDEVATEPVDTSSEDMVAETETAVTE